MCSGEEAQCNSVSTDTNNEELEGTNIFNMDQVIEERKTDHLTKEMKKLADRFPEVLKDSLHGCRAFENVPYQEIEMDPEVALVFRSHIRTTPFT